MYVRVEKKSCFYFLFYTEGTNLIYTLTFNPSLDYVITVPDMKTGEVNRCENDMLYPGGKGINVSLVLASLGIESKALGFVAGFTGNEIERQLQAYKCNTDFIHLNSGVSRINVKLKADAETDLNACGPDIDDDAIKELFDKLNQIKAGDTLVLAGSIPQSVPDDIYEQIVHRLNDRDIRLVVDATGKLLFNVLKYNPFLVKPNTKELGDFFSVEISNIDDVVYYAKSLHEMGAANVLVSMDKSGALLVAEDGNIYFLDAPQGVAVNTVGCGDSMIAGFLKGYTTESYATALKYGIACGSASAFCEWLADSEQINAVLENLK